MTQPQTTRTATQRRVQRIAVGGVLAAIAAILRYIETPLPFFPDFLKIDLSTVPALIGGFALGPVMGTAILFIKNLLYLPATGTGGIGEIADFVISVALVLPAALVYKYRRNRSGAVLGMALGTLLMSFLAGPLMNYYVLIPLYSKFIPLEQIIAISGALNPRVDSLWGYILYIVVPFNLFKCVLTGILTYLLYKPLQPVLHKYR